MSSQPDGRSSAAQYSRDGSRDGTPVAGGGGTLLARQQQPEAYLYDTPVPVAYRQTSGRLGRVFSFPAPVAQFVQRLTGPPPVQRPLSNRSIGRYDSAVEAQRTVMRKKYENEHIDAENFMDTPWLQPDRAKAITDGKARKFASGASSLCISSAELDSMGIAIGLYFRLMKYLAALFFLMSVIAIPVLWICRVGNRFASQDVDPLKLNLWSIGNVNNPGNTSVNGHIFSAEDAALVLSLCDIGYSTLFLVFVIFWWVRVRAVTQAASKNLLQLSDYSVMVKGLPRDATAAQVRDHFDRLYNMQNPDWLFPGFLCCWRQKTKRRETLASHPHNTPVLNPGVQSFRHSATGTPVPLHLATDQPVYNFSNTGDQMYRNSWVAEVTIVHPLGDVIRSFKEQQNRMEQIRLMRAKMKRFNPEGRSEPNRSKFRSAEKRLRKLGKAVTEFEQKNAHLLLNQECVAALVVFNNEDSRSYCLEDYKGSTTSWGLRWQPTPLRFGEKEVPITVIPAPEPSDIIWENVETPARSRLWRQFVTAGILVLLLCGSVIILSVAQHYKAKFEALAPSLGLCNTAIPTGAYEGPPPADAALYHNSSLDCSDGSYYINYMSDGVELDPSLTWGCKPHPQRSSPRCVSVHDTSFSTDKCDPTELTANGTVSLNQTYERYSILGCFCLHSLDSLIATYGVFTGVRKLIDEEGDVCFSFAIQYVTGQSLLIAAALAVVVINAILKGVLTVVTEYERHDTNTEFERSVTIKVFVALFVNTAVIILLVNAKPPFHIPAGIGLLSGQFTSFSPRWYSVAGSSIVLTMMVNTVSPHIPLIFQRLEACFKRRKAYFTKLVTQYQADKLYRPPSFSLSLRVPTVLNTVFITMAFCSGLPLLLPFAFIAMFVMYWIEKTMLLRYYSRPPNINENFSGIVISMLPWALILHLAFSVWMYGDSGCLASAPVNLSNAYVTEKYNHYIAIFAQHDRFGLAPKLGRLIVFPNAALLALLVLLRVLWSVLIQPFWSIIAKPILSFVFCCCLCDHRTALERRFLPAFTSEFNIPLELGDLWEPREEDKADGLQVVPDRKRGEEAKMVVRVWTQHGEFHGVRHAPGQRMLTWEVISLGNIASYNMIANPRYANIKELLLEMEERLRHDQAAIASSFGVRARDVEEELDAEYGDADEAPVPVGRVLAPPVRSQSYAVDGRGVELVRAPQRVLHRYAATENYSPDVSTPVSNPLGPRFTYVDSEGRMHTPPVVGHGGRAAV